MRQSPVNALAEVLRLELVDLEFDGHQAIERPIEEEQVDREIASADLQGILASDETEVAAQFDEELLELLDQPALQIRLAVGCRQVEELQQVAVSKHRRGIRIQFCHHW